MRQRKGILRLGISLLLLGTLLLSGCSAFQEEKPEPGIEDAADSTADYSEESGTHNDDAQQSSQEEPTDPVEVLLTPYDFQEAFEAVCDAVEDGRISEARLDESVSRILTLKLTYGLIS